MDEFKNDQIGLVRPDVLIPQFDNMPEVLTSLPRWVNWNMEHKGGRWTKVPKHPDGYNVSVTNPDSLSTFAAVRAAYQKNPDKLSGVGYVLGEPITDEGRQGFVIAVDFDYCFTDGKPAPFVSEAVSYMRTYTEISPSGKGLRMFLLHPVQIDNRKVVIDGASREIYASKRYMTVTGHGKGKVRYVE